MSEIAATLGIGHEFTFEGKTYKIAPRDFEIEGYFEVWLEDQALLKLQRHRERFSPAEYGIQLDGWRHDCAANIYAFGGLVAWKALCSEPGQKYMALMQIQKASGGSKVVIQELIDRIWDDPEALKEFKAVQERADADPNRPRPWTKKDAANTAA